MFDTQPVLEGELVALRPLRSDDFDALYAVARDPRIWDQHPEPNRFERDRFETFFDAALASKGALLACEASGGRTIGTSLFNAYDAERSEIEIGWTFLALAYWGGRDNGEMKRLMLEHAFTTVKTVIFAVGAQKHRSLRAVEKLGGMRRAPRFDESGREKFVYEITRESFFT